MNAKKLCLLLSVSIGVLAVLLDPAGAWQEGGSSNNMTPHIHSSVGQGGNSLSPSQITVSSLTITGSSGLRIGGSTLAISAGVLLLGDAQAGYARLPRVVAVGQDGATNGSEVFVSSGQTPCYALVGGVTAADRNFSMCGNMKANGRWDFVISKTSNTSAYLDDDSYFALTVPATIVENTLRANAAMHLTGTYTGLSSSTILGSLLVDGTNTTAIYGTRSPVSGTGVRYKFYNDAGTNGAVVVSSAASYSGYGWFVDNAPQTGRNWYMLNGANVAGRMDWYVSSNTDPDAINGSVPMFLTKEGDLTISNTFTQTGAKNCSTGVISTSTGALSGCVASDANLKKNITAFSKSPNVIDQLRAVFYKWRDPSRGPGVRAGFIAQEVEKVYPEAVLPAGPGLKGIDPNAINALLLREIQELRRRVAALEARP